MKTMYKKIALLAGCILYVLLLFPYQAFAQDAFWTIRQEASSTTCAQGKSITVKVYLENQNSSTEMDISAVLGILEYDMGLFTVESSDIIPSTNAEASFDIDTGSFQVSYAQGVVLKSGTELLQIRLHAGKEASSGETTICVTELSWEVNAEGTVENHVPLSITISEPENSLLGDVNLDGKVDKKDAKYIIQYYNGYRILNSRQKKNADMNGDGKIDLLDSKLILEQCGTGKGNSSSGSDKSKSSEQKDAESTKYEALYIDMVESNTVGNTTFYYQWPNSSTEASQKSALYVKTKGGKKTKLSVDGLSPYICTNGEVIYYDISTYDDAGAWIETTHYKINVDGTGNEKLFKEMNAFIIGAYGSRIYYDQYDNNTKKFWVYDTSTGKKKKIIANTGLTTINYGRYFYFGKDAYSNGKLDTIRIYDAKEQKFIGKRKNVSAMKIINTELYYVQKRGNKMSLMKCGLDGSSTATVIKNLKLKKDWHVELSDNKVSFLNGKGKLITKKFS